MPGETISCHFVLTNVLSDDITTVMNSYWIDSVFTLELKPSASSRVSLICTGPGLAHAMTFLHSFIYKIRHATNVGKMTCICLGCSCSTFTELRSSSLLNHIASLQNLPCEYCVAAPVRHFDQQHL